MLADQTNYNIGSSRAPWLNVVASPRAAALASADTAIQGDVLAAEAVDPASLALLPGQQLAVAQNNWLVDTSLQQAAYSYNLGVPGTLALGFCYMNYGSLDRYELINGGNQVQAAGSFSPDGMAVRLAYGVQAIKWLSLGLSCEYVKEDIDTLSSTSFSGNLGLNLNLCPDFTMAFVGENLFGSLHDTSLPVQVKAGAEYQISARGNKDSIKLLADIGMPPQDGSAMSAGGGLEYGYNEILWLRGGYRWQDRGADNAGLSVGLGVKIYMFSADYAYVFQGYLGNSQQFGLSSQF